MDKEYTSQLELFSQAKDASRTSPRISKKFISYVSKYEKALLIVIGFVITGIVSFSLGVEKGKKYIMLKTDSQLDIAAVPKAPVLPKVAVPKQAASEQKYQPVKSSQIKEYIQNYTIQVASFVNKTSAQREAESLKRKGLSPLMLSKGKFIVVCVGNFSNKEEARRLLLNLRKQYQDCHIRRL